MLGRMKRKFSWILVRQAAVVVSPIAAAVVLGYLLKVPAHTPSPKQALPYDPRATEVTTFPERTQGTLYDIWRRSSKPTAMVVYLPSCSSGCGVSIVAKLDAVSRQFASECKVIVLFGRKAGVSTIQRLSTVLTESNSSLIIAYSSSLDLLDQFGVILGSENQHVASSFQQVVPPILVWRGGK